MLTTIGGMRMNDDKELALSDYAGAEPVPEAVRQQRMQDREAEKAKEELEAEQKAHSILIDPNLFSLIDKEFDKKITGEETTRKVIFLHACSIWVDSQGKKPPHLLINSESSAGKSYITKRVYDIFPNELKLYRTRISPTALTYWHDAASEPGWSWDGKLLYLEDISDAVLNCDVFKVFGSEGSEATITVQQRAVDIMVQGKPVMLLTTASKHPATEELLNRLFCVSLDESKEQTNAIMCKQAESYEHGASEEYAPDIMNALRCLRRVAVVIPYASKLPKYFPSTDLRMRRYFSHFCYLIEASAALHQYQREKDPQGRIIANKQDYELARDVISAIQAGSIFNVPYRLKQAYTACKELSAQKDTKGFTAREIHSYAPIVSQKTWYGYLQTLLKMKLLRTELVKTDESDKKVNVYHLGEGGVTVGLPDFACLIADKAEESSNASIPSNTPLAIEASEGIVDFGMANEEEPAMKENQSLEDIKRVEVSAETEVISFLDERLRIAPKSEAIWAFCALCGRQDYLVYWSIDTKGKNYCDRCIQEKTAQKEATPLAQTTQTPNSHNLPNETLNSCYNKHYNRRQDNETALRGI